MEQIIVTHLDGRSIPLQSKENGSIITRAIQQVELLGADTVDITVESVVKMDFFIGDKVTIVGRDYTLNTPPKEQKLAERRFVYNLLFEGVQYDLLRVNYSVNVDTTSNEIQDLSGDSLTGDLKMFLDVLLSNANRVFPGQWLLGSYPIDTETKTLTFSENDNCLSVLQTLCSADNYDTEFSIAIAPNGVRTINMGAMGNIFPYTFAYGKGKGLYDLTREKVSSTNIVTRLSVYGSTRNINTSKYRAFRLCLPGKSKAQSYMESLTGIANYGVWEQTKNFEHIYPHRTGTVGTLGDNELKFTDDTMNFDLNEKDEEGNTLYLIPGASAKVHFNTGNLAGYEFEVTSYVHDTNTFTLRPFTDENGYTFPSETSEAFQFKPGDEYVILDIYLPQSYIDAAEEELETAGQEFLDKYSQPNVMYGLNIDPLFLKGVVGSEVEANIIWVGDYIPVKDDDLDVDKSIRVKGFARDLLQEYAYSLTIADMTVTVNIINRVISGLQGIENVVRINNLNNPARARKNYLNAQEVLSMIFDQEGDYYSEKIKPLSIDTSMLSVGAKYMQFGMTGTMFQPNYAGVKNRVVYEGGALTHYAILDGSGEPRTWTIGNGDVVLGSDDAYYIYAKCQKDDDNGSILFSTGQLLVDSDPAFYHFLIGVINSPGDNDERAVALTYGFTTINGRFINTGRVQSADGQTYFDLDTGVIQGNIRFKSGQSAEDYIDGEIGNIDVGGENLLTHNPDNWELGTFNSTTGNPTNSSVNIRTKNMVTFSANKDHIINRFGSGTLYAYEYTGSGGTGFVKMTTITSFPHLIPKLTSARYYKFRITTSNLNLLGSTYRFKVEQGNIPTDWSIPAVDIEDKVGEALAAAGNAEAQAQALGYLQEAFENDTTITGGVVATSLIRLGVETEKQTWVENAGIFGGITTFGIGGTPRIYAGGTLEDAIARLEDNDVENGAKFVVTHGGTLYAIDVQLMGSLATAHEGQRIVLDHDANRLSLIDETNKERAAITAGSMPILNSLLTGSSGSASSTMTVYVTASEGGDGEEEKQSQLLTLPTSSASYTVSTPPIWGSISLRVLSSETSILKAEAVLKVIFEQITGGGGIGSQGTRTIYSERFIQAEVGERLIPINISAKELTGIPPGTYRLWVYASVDTGGSGTATISAQISSPNNMLHGVAPVNVSNIYRDGIYLIQNANNYMYMNPSGIEEKTQTPPNRPGVLLSGTVKAAGGFDSVWGPKQHATSPIKNSAGRYTVYHSIGHQNYSVAASPHESGRSYHIVSKGNTSFVIMWSTVGGISSPTDTQFDFTISGNN